MTRFAGRRAIVTGAGSGIGRATAARLASEGARVALIDKDGERAHDAAADIGIPDRTAVFAADCADEDQIRRAIDGAAELFGGLDIVVANAGIELLGRDAPVADLDRATWNELLRTNLDGQFLTCKHGIRHLLRNSAGAVVCVGSNCGHLGLARGEPAYSASKGGIYALMRVMAMDYIGSGIRVNLVLPGLIDTPMNATTDMNTWTEQIPIGRAGTAAECAAAISWLASDDASYCVGTALVVDGGQSAI